MGRPLNKNLFGPNVSNTTATATYNTNGAGTITAVTVTGAGSGYTANFSVTVIDGAQSAILTFTVTGGVVASGVRTSQTGAFSLSQTGVSVAGMLVPTGYQFPFQILGTGTIPGSSAGAVYIKKQRSCRKFLCVLASDTTKTGVLVTANTGSPASGQLSIPVTTSVGGTEYVKEIQANKVKTFAGNSYIWSNLTTPSSSTGPTTADVGTDSPA